MAEGQYRYYGIAVKTTNALITNKGVPILFESKLEALDFIQGTEMSIFCYETDRDVNDFRVCSVSIDWW